MKFILMFALAASLAFAQRFGGNEARIRANIRGGGGDGKCTAEVRVDGVAEVAINGDTGRIRTLSGNPASWVRLDCNQALPSNPNDFRFRGIDGRGRQELAADPRNNNGLAVVRIEDPKGGDEGYTFDIEWRGGSSNWTNQGANNSGWGNNNNRPNQGGWGNSNQGGSGWGNNNNNNGWNNGWGDNINFRGRGSGNFTYSNGQNQNVSGVQVNVDRGSSEVTVRLDTSAGNSALEFTGRLQRIDGDTIVANVRNARNQGDSAAANGTMRISMNGRRVKTLIVDGTVNRGRFNVNWRD